MSKKSRTKTNDRPKKNVTRPIELTETEADTCGQALDHWIRYHLHALEDSLGSMGCEDSAEHLTELVKLHARFYRMIHAAVYLVDKKTLRTVASDAAFPVN